MAYWVYKCNSKQQRHQVLFGDWDDFFAGGIAAQWGRVDSVPQLNDLCAKDSILAYQTDRNELVGMAEVVRLNRKGEVILKPVREIRARVRPLKHADPKIAAIDALQPGQIKTIYAISTVDAKRLIKAAAKAAGS